MQNLKHEAEQFRVFYLDYLKRSGATEQELDRVRRAYYDQLCSIAFIFCINQFFK